MATAPPSHELTVRVVADAVDGVEPDALHEAIREAVDETWRAFALPSSASVSVQRDGASRAVDVELQRRPLLLSARRREQIAVAVTGTPRAGAEAADHDVWMRERLHAATAEQRMTLVAALVRATLRAAVADLVTLDAAILARRLLPDADAAQLDHAIRILTLAGELGVAPSQLDLEGPDLASVAAYNSDPLSGCDALLSPAPAVDGLIPRLEMNRRTLRRLTLSERPLRPELIARGEPTLGVPWPILSTLYTEFGVMLPDLRLSVSEAVPDDRFRVRFGSVTTDEQLVLPDTCTAIEMPSELSDDQPEAVYTDPIYGERWPIVARVPESSPREWDVRFHDPASLVVRGLAAELRARAAWWAPRGAIETDWGYVVGPLADQLSELLPPVLRWLLADGATVRHTGPVIESLAAGVLAGETSVSDLVQRSRERLGGAVLGPVAVNAAVHVVSLDQGAVSDAVAAGHPGPLLQAHPELGTETGMLVALCDGRSRAAVRRLLRSLSDVVAVASSDELAAAVIEHAPAVPVRDVGYPVTASTKAST